MLKTMVTAGLMGCLTPADMLSAVQFLRGSDDGVQNLPIGTSPVCHSDKGELPIRRHCVHIETDEDAVWGYLELFGTFTAIAVLGTNYTGTVSKWTYCRSSDRHQSYRRHYRGSHGVEAAYGGGVSFA